jgi:NOL1/NOP2/fmu family ribosome biogenesis protein
MFLEHAVKKVLKEIPVKRALDLCAAPGGKSTHLLNLLPEDALLVSNEVVASRTNILLENIIKWGSANVVVTQNDPVDLGKLHGLFDLMVVDAPCSGSGLFRRDPDAIKEWSPNHVALCSQRQQRILADILPALAPGGFLAYSTCSYSSEEDEGIIDWLVKDFDLEPVSLDAPDGQHGIVVSESPSSKCPCYRFYPGKVKGEGFFMALLRKKGEFFSGELPVKKAKTIPKTNQDGLKEWLNPSSKMVFYHHKDMVFGMPPHVYSFFEFAGKSLNVRKSGVRLGEWMHGKLNPDHELALSDSLHIGRMACLQVEKGDALSFLRKEVFSIPENASKGWLLICYNGYPLGWIKNLGNRFNNYYPKEWRVRMHS